MVGKKQSSKDWSVRKFSELRRIKSGFGLVNNAYTIGWHTDSHFHKVEQRNTFCQKSDIVS